MRYRAGDSTTWYIATGALDPDDIVVNAAAFGEMLAADVLAWEQ